MELTTLRKLQLVELEILKKVHAVCQEYNLHYFLVGGTLLGAERHQGFIPWDDDLDIGLPRQDYDKFIELCRHGALGENYFLQHISTDANYWLPFAKVRKNNTVFDECSVQNLNCHKGIFIDVFPLDYIKRNVGFCYHLKAKAIKKLNNIVKFRGLLAEPPDRLTKFLCRFTGFMSIKTLANFRDSLCSTCKSGAFIINYGSNYKYPKQTMPKEIYEPASEALFEGEYFSAPNKSIEYLERLFNNWNQLPSEEERRNHNPVTIIFDTTKESE